MPALAVVSLASVREWLEQTPLRCRLCGWDCVLEVYNSGAPRAACRAAPAGREPVRRELEARSANVDCYLLMLGFPNTLEPRFGVPINEGATDLGWSKISEMVLKTQSFSSDGVAVLLAYRPR